MAIQSVPATAYRGLSVREVDRVSELLSKACGIADLIGVAIQSDEDLADDAIPSGCWAIRDMLDEVKLIVTGKTER